MASEDERDAVESARLMELVREKVAELGETFECVQVFVSRCEGDGTRGICLGYGNVFAREGQVQRWLEDGALSDDAECIPGDDD